MTVLPKLRTFKGVRQRLYQAAIRRSVLRCALCHDRLGADPVACPDCETLLHRECAREVRGCPTLGCAGWELTFAQHMERRDGPLVRRGMWVGALLGALVGLAFPLETTRHMPLFWVVLASLLRGAMSGFLLGPILGFIARAAFREQAAAHSCPVCAAPLSLAGAFCKTCGYDRDLEQVTPGT